MDYTPSVLRNKGVPVRLAALRKEDDAWIQTYDSEGNIETEEFHVRFTHNTIADIEEVWDGLPDWQDAMANKPVSTLRRTYGLILSEPVEKVGMRFIEGQLGTYNNAIGTAWALANGVDPTVASRLLEQAEIATDSQVTMLNEELSETLNEVEEEKKATRGKQPSQPGAKGQTKGTKTSGTKAQAK